MTYCSNCGSKIQNQPVMTTKSGETFGSGARLTTTDALQVQWAYCRAGKYEIILSTLMYLSFISVTYISVFLIRFFCEYSKERSDFMSKRRSLNCKFQTANFYWSNLWWIFRLSKWWGWAGRVRRTFEIKITEKISEQHQKTV